MIDLGLVCQGCGSPGLERLLDLGSQPLCNDFLPAGDAPKPQIFYPLCICVCHKCSLAQLDYVIPTEVSFGDQYTYLTGSSESLIRYYSELAGRLKEKFDLRPGDTIIEIGSNDGTFLKAFQSLGLNVLGIEGATVSSNISVANGIPVIQQFFRRGLADTVKERLQSGSSVRLVLAMNVLAHTDNINDFLAGLVDLMEPNTVFVSQSHWLAALTRNFEFDTIYHEHLRYYTLTSLMRLFDKHGLNIEDAEITDFYGGSVLAYAKKSAGPASEGLKSILADENELNVVQSLRDMKQVLLTNKARLLNLLVDARNSGKRVVGIGAPMKASTLLNYYGVTADLVEYLGEVNQLKVGTVVPGVRIPVVHEDLMFQEQPDYALLLSWNMADFLIPKFRARGYQGKFILPVPHVEVIE
ncbi:MAG: class I SAM-dependent methyltransferase [Nitrospirales bacterium]